jgi:hypothetical protein
VELPTLPAPSVAVVVEVKAGALSVSDRCGG